MDKPGEPPDDEFFSNPLLPGLSDDINLGSELLQSEDPARNYTGKIVEKNAERVQAILAARAMGFPLRIVCEGFHVSPHTVAELERRHATKLATLKDRIVRKAGAFVELGLDRLLDPKEIKRMDIDKLMVSVGIAIDKMQVLSGEPSVIVGTADVPTKFTIDGMRERLARREPINVTPTGSGDGEIEATRAREALPPAAGSADDQGDSTT
jgi:hypothetical protein